MADIIPNPDIITNPEIPYLGCIPAALFPSKTIFIEGYVQPHCEKFQVNLQCGSAKPPETDIALHFSAHFDSEQRNNPKVVCNTLLSREWGRYQTKSVFPFVKGKNFNVSIRCEEDKFKVEVNGSPFTSFTYRIPDLQRVTYIYIGGDVKIYKIRYSPPSLLTPYFRRLRDSLFGTTIKVKLWVKPKPTRFEIRLQSSMQQIPKPTNSDVAFCFNPRFHDATIWCYCSREGGRPEKEEKTTTFFPFVASGTYEITILCMKTCYVVLVDGTKIAEYNHQLGMRTVHALAVFGDVTIR